jgi:hypothetical protein
MKKKMLFKIKTLNRPLQIKQIPDNSELKIPTQKKTQVVYNFVFTKNKNPASKRT